MPTYFILMLMFAHWIGDFVLQTEQQATMKSRSGRYLLEHVGTWMVPIAMFILFYFTLIGTFEDVPPPLMMAKWIAYNLLGHIIIDGITSRFNSRFKQDHQESYFWNMIGFDQWLHLLVLLGTAEWLLFPNWE